MDSSDSQRKILPLLIPAPAICARNILAVRPQYGLNLTPQMLNGLPKAGGHRCSAHQQVHPGYFAPGVVPRSVLSMTLM